MSLQEDRRKKNSHSGRVKNAMKKEGKQNSSGCDNLFGVTIAGNSFSTWYRKHELYTNTVLCSVQLLEHLNTHTFSAATSSFHYSYKDFQFYVRHTACPPNLKLVYESKDHNHPNNIQ